MASKSSQLKSILKDSVSPPNEPKQSAREIAIHHATLLEHRKQLESQILDSLILLSEYPLVRETSYNASNPAPSDVSDFKANVRLFQPSDYDDLIEERNVNELCGYTLCPKPRRQTGSGGEWKLTNSGEIVKRKELEKWCSQQCARRALFVKVQLNETAAWERAGIPDIQIDLLDEDKSAETEADRTARKLGELKLEDQRQAARDSAALAMERGDNRIGSSLDKVKVTLKEKDVKAPSDMVPPPGADNSEAHLLIDGFKAKLPDKQTGESGV
ncbi:RNA polymerase II subunit B1 CTD phosphatase RPAP2-like protein [Trichoderma simmonsii]|uniref:RNA polymerase II subunit B1 CTD phosphatase RPAP2 homolog n=1 Tax=Trichoderma simmonsii TaxID=1491479 RepID=A0A8G0LQR7_9HYPO|nr:RNA polymerase II subunit B1 CTD phosphatase RPAP2-like protein [Trichoderma simmonsii]